MFGNLWTLLFSVNTEAVNIAFSALLTNLINTATPLFFVWVLSLFVWFGLELAVLNAHFFNVKHSYISEIKRQFISMIAYTVLYKNTKKTAVLVKFYAYSL